MNKKISNQDKSWLDAALKLCDKSQFTTYKMGCILVSGGRVISYGLNRNSPGVLKSPLYAKKSLHCELDCLMNIEKKQLKGSKLYIAGKSRGGNIIKSMPCSICLPYIVGMGIGKVFYFERDGSHCLLDFSSKSQ